MDKNKVFYLSSTFTKELPSSDEQIESIYIEGYANTTTVDRVGDVVTMEAWQNGMANYLKNPIILAHHEYDDPIGRMEDYRVDPKGLWVKARISAAAEETFNLIKDGVLTAFSVGFRVLDATYDSVSDIFVIKEVELLEISVVSVPANQESIFSLSKSFENKEEFLEFKKSFASKEDNSAKGLEESKEAFTSKKEINMDPKELEQMIAQATAKALAEAEEKRKAEEAAAKAKAAEEAALEAKIKNVAESIISTEKTGAEKLLEEVEKRLNEAAEGQKNILSGLESAIKEKAEELAKIQSSKMNFSDKGSDISETYEEREKAYMLSRIMGKSIEDTRYGRSVIEKVGAHLPSATWELEVSRNMENEIRRRLVVAPILRNIEMQTNVMTIPVNPEAGDATWMANTAFGTTESAGAAQTHQLKEITLNAYKVATREYLAYEEEEDSLLVLMPVIRDAMIRRVARGVDKAFLLGAGAGADPVKGLSLYDTTSVVTPTNTGAASVANLRSLRKDLGVWGLDPADVVYIVSTEVYYDLLDDTAFQTMDKVGNAATLLTGQVGSIGNSPVIVSGTFPTKAGGAATASTNIGAIALAAGNFIVGNQRGLRFDTQDLVETQRKVLVASLRTGLTQISTVNGMGVSTLRWS
jgi:HK97 family phage prohead protease/HK97 family phage major capsid protein